MCHLCMWRSKLHMWSSQRQMCFSNVSQVKMWISHVEIWIYVWWTWMCVIQVWKRKSHMRKFSFTCLKCSICETVIFTRRKAILPCLWRLSHFNPPHSWIRPWLCSFSRTHYSGRCFRSWSYIKELVRGWDTVERCSVTWQTASGAAPAG